MNKNCFQAENYLQKGRANQKQITHVDLIIVIRRIGQSSRTPLDKHFGNVKCGDVLGIVAGFDGIEDYGTLLFEQLGGLPVPTDVVGGDRVTKVENFDVFVGRIVDNLADDGDDVGGYFFGTGNIAFVV